MFSLFPVINFGKTETIEKNLFSQNWKRFNFHNFDFFVELEINNFFDLKMINFKVEAA
jgi:hypothetical protein